MSTWNILKLCANMKREIVIFANCAVVWKQSHLWQMFLSHPPTNLILHSQHTATQWQWEGGVEACNFLYCEKMKPPTFHPNWWTQPTDSFWLLVRWAKQQPALFNLHPSANPGHRTCSLSVVNMTSCQSPTLRAMQLLLPLVSKGNMTSFAGLAWPSQFFFFLNV